MFAGRHLVGNTLIHSVIMFALLLASPVLASENEPKVGDDGMHTQDWFKHTSFLDMADDLQEAQGQGKHLAILFEQKGCPYCREMHRVNFADADIRNYIQKNFDVVQLNLWGDREVTDFDGEQLSEKKFGRKYRVMFTPTILFIDEKGEEVVKQLFAYAAEKGYVEQPNFQRWLSARADEMRAQGKEVKLWD